MKICTEVELQSTEVGVTTNRLFSLQLSSSSVVSAGTIVKYDNYYCQLLMCCSY